MTRRRVWVAAALVAAFAVAARPAGAGRVHKDNTPPSIDISSANYGPAAADSHCDVTNELRAVCSGHISCSVPVDRRLCPAPSLLLGGLIMSLTVTFRCVAGENPRTISGEGPLSLEIRCR